jgi:hypothetical protein
MSEGRVRDWVGRRWEHQRCLVSEDMHMVDRDQTASTQTDCLGLPGWAMDGAHAGWCAPALIAVVFVGTGKHMGMLGCRFAYCGLVAADRRKVVCRTGGQGPAGWMAGQVVSSRRSQRSQRYPKVNLGLVGRMDVSRLGHVVRGSAHAWSRPGLGVA